jgi:AsmA family protein
MQRKFKPLLIGLLALAGIVAILALLLGSELPERFAENRITAATGREAHIGDIELRIGRCFGFTVRDVRVVNPEWAKTPELANGRLLSGCASYLPLFVGRADLKEVRVEGARLGLEREGDLKTWDIDKEDDDGPSRVAARHVSIVDSTIYFRDRDQKTEMDIAASGGVGAGDEVVLRAKGRFRDAPMTIVASTAGRAPSAEEPAMISAAATLGRTTAVAVGRFNELGIEGMAVQLALAGENLSEINRLGINLPDTPPYKLRGRLMHADNTWDFSPFEGRIGDSDLSGTFAYILREPRPLLRADIRAHLLDFDDLGPLVGAPPKTGAGETSSPEQKAKAQQVAARDRVLPNKPLGVDKWPRMDADVRFRADRVQRPNALPINGLSTHLVIDNSRMRLDPLNFEVASGKVKANIMLEGKTSPPHGSADIRIDNLELAEMFPKLNQERAAAGKLYGTIKFNATGDSIAKLAATSNGELTLMVNGGHMSALLLELAGLDGGEALMILFSRGDKPVPLRCAIADFNIKSGQAETELAAIDTVDTLFIVDGKVDLDNEALDLKVTPQPKDRSILVVRTPLLVGGHFNDPNVKPQAGPLAARGGAAVALGLINPLLAVIPLIETGPGKDSDCAAFATIARAEGVKTAPQTKK